MSNHIKSIVTGAAGFMGSHLVDSLLGLGHRVYAIDDLSGGYLENVNKKAEFAQIDLTDEKKTSQYIEKVKPDYLFHLAATASVGRSQFTPVYSTKNNYIAYLNALVPAIRTKVKKVILVSSMDVYGEQKPPFTEDMQPKAVDIYGLAKEAMERATALLSKVHGFEYTIVRPHNVYGPRQNMADPYRNVISIFINRMLANKNFYVYGDGEQVRSFTYIDDFNPYLVEAAFGNFNGQIFNIGPEEPVTINKLAGIVLSHFVDNPKKPPKNLKPVHIPDRPLEVKEAYCDNTKAKKLLGFVQKTKLEDGVAKTVAWAKKSGHKPFKYLDNLEIVSENTPKTWVDQLI